MIIVCQSMHSRKHRDHSRVQGHQDTVKYSVNTWRGWPNSKWRLWKRKHDNLHCITWVRDECMRILNNIYYNTKYITQHHHVMMMKSTSPSNSLLYFIGATNNENHSEKCSQHFIRSWWWYIMKTFHSYIINLEFNPIVFFCEVSKLKKNFVKLII